MSVSCYFGLTESGKSFHVENHVMPSWGKVVVFDNACCFSNGDVVKNPSDAQILKLFQTFSKKEKYQLIIRPDRSGSAEALFNKTVQLSVALGRSLSKERVSPEKRIQMITDEADFVCSPHYQSWELKHLVNKGRHDNVDSHFIARSPMRIHTDIRVNASKIVTFRLQNASSIQLFTENFGHELTKKVKELPKYWRLEWRDNGEVAIYDEKNSKNDGFLKKKTGVLK